MNPAQLVVGIVIALAASIRGNWSPCGESLQARLHPLGERSRGNNWAITITSFTVVSAIAGGSSTGLLGLLGSISPVESELALLITGLLGLTAGALDLSPLRPWTPNRQVNENWIERYRGWVYGAAFGAQLGVGFAVFVMSWGYYAMLGAAFLTGSFSTGAMLGAVFGVGRGLLLILSFQVRSPQGLASFHTRMAQLKRPVFLITGLTMLGAGVLVIL